jgi:hypothetical protein
MWLILPWLHVVQGHGFVQLSTFLTEYAKHAHTWLYFICNHIIYSTCNLFYKVYGLSTSKLFFLTFCSIWQTAVLLTPPLTKQMLLVLWCYSCSIIILPLSNNNSHSTFHAATLPVKEPTKSETFKVMTHPSHNRLDNLKSNSCTTIMKDIKAG